MPREYGSGSKNLNPTPTVPYICPLLADVGSLDPFLQITPSHTHR